MSDCYVEINGAMSAAGFFVTSVEDMGNWHRVTACSRRRDDGLGYTGNSFWISKTNGRWFVGAWGGNVYVASTSEDVIAFSLAWLTHEPNETRSDFDQNFVDQYGFVPADDEFEGLISKP